MASPDAVARAVETPRRVHRAAPVIITGTNGKTSTARMIEGPVAHTTCVGRFTSPHLESVTERICINGAPVPDTTVRIWDEHRPLPADCGRGDDPAASPP